MRQGEIGAGILRLDTGRLQFIQGARNRPASYGVRFQHDSHIESIVGRLFKRANDVAVRQDVYFQPDGLACALDSVGYRTFAIIGFDVDTYTLHAGAACAIALTLVAATGAGRETEATPCQGHTQK